MIAAKFELASHREKQFSAYVFIARDLDRAQLFANYLLKHKLYAEMKRRKHSGIHLQQLAFTNALITNYARPFTRTDGGAGFPGRSLRQLSVEQKALHHRILELRKKIFAHTDADFQSAVLATVQERTMVVMSYPGEVSLGLRKQDIESLVEVITVLREGIRHKIAEKAQEFEEQHSRTST